MYADANFLLGCLPPEQRAAILMTAVEGLSIVEAAARSGVGAGTVKSRIHRGRERMVEIEKSARAPPPKAARADHIGRDGFGALQWCPIRPAAASPRDASIACGGGR